METNNTLLKVLVERIEELEQHWKLTTANLENAEYDLAVCNDGLLLVLEYIVKQGLDVDDFMEFVSDYISEFEAGSDECCAAMDVQRIIKGSLQYE